MAGQLLHLLQALLSSSERRKKATRRRLTWSRPIHKQFRLPRRGLGVRDGRITELISV